MGWLSKYPMLTLYLKSYMSGGRGLPKPRHTHATTPVSRKHQFSSAILHVSMFLDDIASCHDVPMTLTGVFTTLLDIPIATLVVEIQFWVSVPQELHAVAHPPVWDRFVPVFGRLLLNDCQSIFSGVFKWDLSYHDNRWLSISDAMSISIMCSWGKETLFYVCLTMYETVYPTKYTHVFFIVHSFMIISALFIELPWYIYPYTSGLLHWNWDSHMVTWVPVK